VLALLKQYRELLLTLGLLLFPFFVYLVYSKHGRDLLVTDRLVLTATGPIESHLTEAINWGEDRWGDYVALRGVRAENLKLRTEVLRLQEESLAAAELRQENDRLRVALDFAKTVPLTTVAAPVIGIGGTSTFLSITIGRGDKDGIRKGMAVVTPQGVVGKVETVAPGYAQVLLITDANSKVAVESQRSRARATVRGNGENKICKLDLAERAALFEEGDMLITTGTDGVFPKGIAVGRVSNIERKGKSYNLSAEVLPSAPFNTVEEVLVVTGSPLPVQGGMLDPALLKLRQTVPL
jgi:rod shape-determining protein MreC